MGQCHMNWLCSLTLTRLCPVSSPLSVITSYRGLKKNPTLVPWEKWRCLSVFRLKCCYLCESNSKENWLWYFHMLSKYSDSVAGHTGGCDCNNSIFVPDFVCEGEILEQSTWRELKEKYGVTKHWWKIQRRMNLISEDS